MQYFHIWKYFFNFQAYFRNLK